MPGGVCVLLVEAESKLTELMSINSGPKRTFTVAESILWTNLCGVQFAAEVAGSWGCTPPSPMATVRDRIAQRPQMARSARLAEGIYKLKGTMRKYVTERS